MTNWFRTIVFHYGIPIPDRWFKGDEVSYHFAICFRYNLKPMVSLMTYSGLFLFLAYVTLKIQVLFTASYVGMFFQWSCKDVRVGL